MPYHEFSAPSEHRQEHQIEISGGARVARIFLPAIDNCSAIRLAGRGHSLVTVLRELARTIEPRRRAS
jgi:hypothetical protein